MNQDIERAKQDGWEVKKVEFDRYAGVLEPEIWYEARNNTCGFIARRGYESPQRYKTEKGAWNGIAAMYRKRRIDAQMRARGPVYLGD